MSTIDSPDRSDPTFAVRCDCRSHSHGFNGWALCKAQSPSGTVYPGGWAKRGGRDYCPGCARAFGLKPTPWPSE